MDGPNISAAEGARRIREQIAKGEAHLRKLPISVGDQRAWETGMQQVVTQAFGAGSHCIASVMARRPTAAGDFNNEERLARNRRDTMRDRLKVLAVLAESLEQDAALIGNVVMERKFDLNRVFIVHGHEAAVVHECARMIELFGLEPVILHEQPNEGRTIIEKFEHHADAGFAVAFLTPDDFGAANGAEAQPRARQNVVFELGFFGGLLGRKRTCALYRDGVELPSDYDGVLYVSLDREDWKRKLAQEMKAAGLDVDMNKIK
jgi:predicted nucleotide-binding protein